MDAHVQRAELLGDHPFEIGLGESREGGEVAVEERQAVVVVLQVEAAPHALRQLVDEAEGAVVVAGAHPVEHRGLEVDAERRARGLVDHQELLEAAAANLELDARLVSLDLVPDDVAHRFSVEREKLVARSQPGVVSRRTRCNRRHPGHWGGGHGSHPTGAPR